MNEEKNIELKSKLDEIIIRTRERNKILYKILKELNIKQKNEKP